MATPKITLYLDVVSPFGYLAYYVLRHSPIFRPCEIEYVPVFLGGLMKACNNRPPLEIKNKNKWIGKERLRWASLFNIPITRTMPPNFPPLTLQVQRVLTALQLSSPSSLPTALDALYHCFWVEGTPDINNPSTFGPVLEKALGKELAVKVMEDGKEDNAKNKLKENTDRAFEGGAFGMPWFECVNRKGETEGFWGFDHLGQVVSFLELNGEGGGKVETGLVEGMKAML
ncbi:hypothetical protein EPUS_00656 [Endocarpon pusillum Z07020]|uniref:Glutathione S-transferase kappa n=1 Tax=Endocarpon pusillum (strain Z07020 / HMAS-L-300199) TaxID=1263415 RepID=U1G325_ENDPU|nr:uncharacterized protein EPUS_00656 [Endocarpon pusillum Z07020]ERF71667.1 hypothetical protein EPUS_00656 [Endocarpon pusillum Z07020]